MKVFIIVLTYNEYSGTQKLLHSLQFLTYKDCSIVIVDNNSSDGSNEKLKQAFPSNHFVQSNDNQGYAAGNNIGIKYAINHGADYLLILNNDLEIKDMSIIEKLLEGFNKHEDVGFMGAKLLFKGTNLIQFVGSKINEYGGPRHLHYNMEDINLGYQKYELTDYASGACMMFKADLIKRIGYMEEGYFIYFEETDWNLKARLNGLKCIVRTDAVAYHKHGNFEVRASYYLTRNYIYFCKKHNFKYPFLKHTFITFLRIIWQLLHFKKYSYQRAYAMFMGFLHGHQNVRGKWVEWANLK